MPGVRANRPHWSCARRLLPISRASGRCPRCRRSREPSIAVTPIRRSVTKSCSSAEVPRGLGNLRLQRNDLPHDRRRDRRANGMPLLVDTGILYALADRRDAWHQKVRRYLEAHRQPLLAPATIVPEVAYLIRHRISAHAERVFVSAIVAGEVAIEDLSSRDWKRIEALMDGYDTLGFVDASVVAIAERLRLTTVATTDRRDFAMVKHIHVDRFHRGQ